MWKKTILSNCDHQPSNIGSGTSSVVKRDMKVMVEQSCIFPHRLVRTSPLSRRVNSSFGLLWDYREKLKPIVTNGEEIDELTPLKWFNLFDASFDEEYSKELEKEDHDLLTKQMVQLKLDDLSSMTMVGGRRYIGPHVCRHVEIC